MLLPYWDRSGNVHQFEATPQSVHDWAQGEEVPADQQGLHTAVKETLGQALIRTRCKGQDMNIVGSSPISLIVFLRRRLTRRTDAGCYA